MRKDKINYYLDIAESVLGRGTCLRRKFGAIIVKNDEIVSTGYAGAPRGRKNCCDIGTCRRQELGVAPGERYELCRSVHAEANAIISASRNAMIGGYLFLACRDAVTGELTPGTEPCSMCKRLIINAGIEKVYIRDTETEFREFSVRDWIYYDDSLGDHKGY